MTRVLWIVMLVVAALATPLAVEAQPTGRIQAVNVMGDQVTFTHRTRVGELAREVAPMRFRAGDLSPARVGAAAHDTYIFQHLIGVVLGQAPS